MPLFLSTARVSGLLYLALGAMGGFSIAFLPAVIHVPDDLQATFNNALGSMGLFRASIASGLAHKIFLLGLAFLFADLFGRERALTASLMVALVAVSVPIYFIVMRDLYASLPLLLQGVEPLNSNATAFMINVEAYLTGLELVSVFWGLWLLPLGYLIVKTRRVPRILGALLIAGGIGYLLNFFGPLLLPKLYANALLSVLMATISAVGEIGLALWLIAFGVKPSAAPEQIAVSRASSGSLSPPPKTRTVS